MPPKTDLRDISPVRSERIAEVPVKFKEEEYVVKIEPKNVSPQYKTEVFVVFKGEDYEGGSNQGIFTNEEAAREHVRYLIEHCFNRREWKQLSDYHWKGGCDYIEINTESVYATHQQWVDDCEEPNNVNST